MLPFGQRARPGAQAVHEVQRAVERERPPLRRRVAANLNVEVGFYNVAEVVRARLSAQNVLTPEGARE